jgi:predicted GNAT superfamily acetyltransferase
MTSDLTPSPAPTSPDFTVRDCVSLDDFAACVRLQREVWQFSDLDITPVRSFVITRRSGGCTIGAFDGAGRLLGFSHMLPAFDERLRPYFYSHMLAVEPGARNAGVGVALKLAQRRRALERGVPLIVWTFDPLQSRNAHLNLVKLGGVVRTYHVNYYGNASTSALHRGLDTDRLFVEWWVGSTRVKEAVEEGGAKPSSAAVASVEVPFDIEELKARDLEEARRWQVRIRAAFQQHLAAGLYCAGFERGRQNEPGRYLFFADTREEVPHE